jgi:hypothetical protein
MPKYENPENIPIALVRLKKMAGAPTMIITDPVEDTNDRLDGEPLKSDDLIEEMESLPTIPAVKAIVPCTACQQDFGGGTCEVCGGTRIIPTMEKVEDSPS